MAVEAKDKVVTVELAGSIADQQKKYIDAAVKKVQDAVDELPTSEDLLEAATSSDITDIINKFQTAD